LFEQFASDPGNIFDGRIERGLIRFRRRAEATDFADELERRRGDFIR
jgi:hypothetical protein